MLRKVYLEGEIADKFGSEFDMDVSTFGEAVQCFELNFSNFREYLMECQEKGIGFICSVEDTPLEDEMELLLEHPKGSLTIQAVPAGAKSGFGKILAAIALIVIAYNLPWLLPGIESGVAAGTAGWAAAGTTMFYVQAAFVMVGINLAMAGIQQLMAPDPSVDGQQQDDSYLFQGSAQQLIEGDPVPVLYGKLRVPGRPISFEIKNENRSFTDYAQPGYDFVTIDDSGGSSGNGGSDSPSEDYGPDEGFSIKQP